MSFENTSCPCGGKKPTGIMLCDECVAAFQDRRELADYQDGKQSIGYRRQSALILVALARRRKRAAIARATGASL